MPFLQELSPQEKQALGFSNHHFKRTVSPAEIVAAGTGASRVVRIEAQAGLYRVRSDFPVHLSLDGDPLGHQSGGTRQASAAFAGNQLVVHNLEIAKPVSVFELRLPSDLGGVTDADAYARHGNCTIEGLPYKGGARFEQPEPSLRPTQSVNVIGVWAALTTLTVNLTRAVFEGQHNGLVPIRIWLQHVSLMRTDNTNTSITPEFTLRATLRKNNLPSGDTQSFFRAHFDSANVLNIPLRNAYIPLYSCFSAYAAETPQLEWFVEGVAPVGTDNMHTSIYYAYEL